MKRTGTKAAAASNLHDVSSPQPRLPIPEAQWDPLAFAKRCALTRVPATGRSPVKLFYLSLALFGQPLAKSDVSVFRIRLENLLFSLQISENTFYKFRALLMAAGLVDIKRTAKSTYVRVFAKRMMAEPVPFAVDPWVQERLPVTAHSGESDSAHSGESDSAHSGESDSAHSGESIDLDLRRGSTTRGETRTREAAKPTATGAPRTATDPKLLLLLDLAVENQIIGDDQRPAAKRHVRTLDYREVDQMIDAIKGGVSGGGALDDCGGALALGRRILGTKPRKKCPKGCTCKRCCPLVVCPDCHAAMHPTGIGHQCDPAALERVKAERPWRRNKPAAAGTTSLGAFAASALGGKP